jgi:hypothetical protein
MERPVPVGVSLPIGDARSCRPGRTPHENAISQLPPHNEVSSAQAVTSACLNDRFMRGQIHLVRPFPRGHGRSAANRRGCGWKRIARRLGLPCRREHTLTRSKMAVARAELLDSYLTRWRHCVTRRVRRAFLLGNSPTTARSGLRTGSRNRMKDKIFRGSQMDAQYLQLPLRQLEF